MKKLMLTALIASGISAGITYSITDKLHNDALTILNAEHATKYQEIKQVAIKAGTDAATKTLSIKTQALANGLLEVVQKNRSLNLTGFDWSAKFAEDYNKALIKFSDANAWPDMANFVRDNKRYNDWLYCSALAEAGAEQAASRQYHTKAVDLLKEKFPLNYKAQVATTSQYYRGYIMSRKHTGDLNLVKEIKESKCDIAGY